VFGYDVIVPIATLLDLVKVFKEMGRNYRQNYRFYLPIDENFVTGQNYRFRVYLPSGLRRLFCCFNGGRITSLETSRKRALDFLSLSIVEM